jgi:hypothetical protein
VAAAVQKERQAVHQSSPPDQGGLEVCAKVPAKELRHEDPEMILMGTIGSIRFHGYERALVCSEPGPGGVGECEIVADSLIKVVSPSGTFGLKPLPGRVPSLLVYGPETVYCKPRK